MKSHGLSYTRFYKIWQNMLTRCTNPKYTYYHNYGGKGITICKRWLSFTTFYKDMGECPERLTLERIDNNKGYFPDNCKWATRKEQSNNTKRNVIIEYDGQKLTMMQWARKLGMNYQTLFNRIHSNWSIDRAFNQPVRSMGRMR